MEEMSDILNPHEPQESSEPQEPVEPEGETVDCRLIGIDSWGAQRLLKRLEEGTEEYEKAGLCERLGVLTNRDVLRARQT